MNNEVIYLNIKRKLETTLNNINDILSDINDFKNNCSSALVLNNSTSYKTAVINIKTPMEEQKNKIKNEILTEINNNLITKG